MNRPRVRIAVLAITMTALLATGVSQSAAQSTEWGQAKGWFLDFRILSDHIGAEDPGPDSPQDAVFVEEQGGGVGLGVGYTFTPSFALRLALGGARHETTQEGVELVHASITLEAVARFLHGQRAQPYLYGGLGGATLEFTSGRFESRTSGGVAVLGAGVEYHLTRHLALDAGARLDLINWDRVEVSAEIPGGGEVRLEDPVDESGSAAKLLLGLVWHF